MRKRSFKKNEESLTANEYVSIDIIVHVFEYLIYFCVFFGLFIVYAYMYNVILY